MRSLGHPKVGCRYNSAEMMLVVSFSVELEIIMKRAGSATTNEVINVLNQENFNLSVFNHIIKKSVIVRLQLKNVVDRYKE